MSLFRAIVKSFVKNLGNFASGLVGVPIAGEMIVDAWEYWQKDTDEQKRKAELEAHARQAVKDALPEALEAVRLEAPRLPAAQRQLLVDYLCQVPATIQRSLRRPEDGTGQTVPVRLALRHANDLMPFLPPTLPRFKAGDLLPGRSNWVLDRHLSGGGFGEVWLACQQPFGLQGAVKFCKSADNRDRDLLHEGNVIARVRRAGKHPNVVPLLDSHLDGDAPWLMYEYVEGGDLGDVIRHWAKLKPVERQERAVTALRSLADAVGHFHGLKPPIVHRDLKPANILYDKSARRLRITDFGIGGIAAREIIDGDKRGTLTSAARLQSHLYGSYTPLYASPQQMNGAPPDPRDDVHALGVIAYQLLTCQMSQSVGPDFAHDLRELGIDEALMELVGRCTAQKAERRPKNAGELSEMLARLSSRTRALEAQIIPEPVLAVVPTTAPSAPVARLAPSNPVAEAHYIQTTVCPECNAEVHIDSRKCPHCGALVQRGDRFVHACAVGLMRVFWIVLGLFGLMLIIGSIGVTIERQTISNVLVGLPIGIVCLVPAIWKFVRTRSKSSKPS